MTSFNNFLKKIFFSVVFTALVLAACSGGREPGAKVGDATARWQVIGPGGGGSMFTPTVSPHDPDHVFLRCDMTGAYVSRDGGRQWRMFNLRSVVQDFEFDPQVPGRAYAAGSGLYRTDDWGESWTLIYPEKKDIAAERMVADHGNQWFETPELKDKYRAIEKVRVDPDDNSRLFIGTSAFHYSRDSLPQVFVTESITVFSSVDGGETWTTAPIEIPGRHVREIYPGSWWGRPGQALVISDRAAAWVGADGAPQRPVDLPVESVEASDGGSGTIYVLAGMKQGGGKPAGGVYRSTDAGASWTQVNGNLLESYAATGKLPYFNTLAVCAGQPEVVYLSCRSYTISGGDGKASRLFGVLKSTEGGNNWQWIYRSDGQELLGGDYNGGWMLASYGPGYTGNPHGLGVSPNQPDVCYSTDWGRASRTTDGGRTWSQLYARKLPGDAGYTTTGLDVTTCYGMHFDPLDAKHMFISYTDIGLFGSRDGGASWSHSLQGVPPRWWNTCYWVEFDPVVQGRIWSVWGNGHDLPRLKMFRRAGFVDRFQGGVALSEDGGATWKPSLGSGIPENTVCSHVLVDPTSPPESRTLYVCGTGRGVFKSTDGGANWSTANQGLGPNLNTWRTVLLPDGTLYLIVMRALNDDHGLIDGALYRSTDQAANWQPVPLPQGVTGPNDLVYDPRKPQTMYLSCWPSPKDFREYGGGLLRTDDGGESWHRVFAQDVHVVAAALDPDNPETIVVNTFDSAAFRSDDGGKNWYRLGGYNFKWGHRPQFDPHNKGMLYLLTFGGSVYHGPARGVPDALEDITDKSMLRWYDWPMQ
jgi:photosystem II stability/assembly factor-like uncharacterized protein